MGNKDLPVNVNNLTTFYNELKNHIDSELNNSSTNPIQNKTVTTKINKIENDISNLNEEVKDYFQSITDNQEQSETIISNIEKNLYLGTIKIEGEISGLSVICGAILDLHSILSNNQKCMVIFNANNQSYIVWGCRVNTTRGRYYFSSRTSNTTYSGRITSTTSLSYAPITIGSETTYTKE